MHGTGFRGGWKICVSGGALTGAITRRAEPAEREGERKTMYIEGNWTAAASGAVFDVFNPADGEKIGEVPDGGREDAVMAIDAACKAFDTWSRATAYSRSKYLYDAYRIMMERKEELARTMTGEQGKPLKAARNEVQYGADFLLWYAEEAKRNYGETIPAPRPDQRFIVLRQPVGVVGAVTPWNYPVSMITRKVAPAIAAGCTIVLKPAEATPPLRHGGVQCSARRRYPGGGGQPGDRERSGAHW